MTTFTAENDVARLGLDYTNMRTIHFQSGKCLHKAGMESLRRVVLMNVTMPKQNFNLGEYPGQPGICQGPFVNSVEPSYLPTGEGLWLIGSPLLKAYYTVWDGLNFRIGWAQLNV